MFKTLFFVAAILAVVLAESTFEQVPFGSESANARDEISRPSAVGNLIYEFVPPDNGLGNYGDNLWRERVQGYKDSLLTREVLINTISPGNDHFAWGADFPGKNITHIRFLNIGRQRAWVHEVRCNGGSTAGATIRMPGRQQYRLLIEVYGL